jgi:hypothetical protein
MRSKYLLCTVAANTLFLAAGIAVGQRAGSSKFEKYLRPATPTEMDWITLRAEVGAIRLSVPVDNFTAPKLTFDYKANRLEATVIISSDFEKGSLETVKTRILALYLLDYDSLKSTIPKAIGRRFCFEHPGRITSTFC